MQAFDWTRLPDGRSPYRVTLCAESAEVRTEGLAFRIERGLEALETADTIIVPGRSEESGPPSDRVLEALRRAAGAGTRIASVCVGASLLARAGLLDGLRATTHWMAAAELARRHPRVDVRPDVLYVDNGQILTSAGAAAGLDMCLHMIRRDLGPAVAAQAARMCVVPLEREGGQAQFIVHEHPPVPRGVGACSPVDRGRSGRGGRPRGDGGAFGHERAHLQPPVPRADRHHSPAVAAAGPGARPVPAGERGPVGRTDARQAGFGSSTAFRERFRRVVGTTPYACRAAFRAKTSASPDGSEAPLAVSHGQ
ncbi:transcriptional regulator GlxA family with amidase domain [Streptomyces coelicolor]|nr:transcriptional regulator GlxA family with amidase domain [Streptomyces coelicolor]TYP16111.1 transcriptional regulator GlxA family with amidase domain [Streptomyces coelicolor A3(2)]TYP35858.1 transcriptional regulator GlxA family with amidase domain [Streptomyces coelicolor]TYP40773.1 transcriptional regulator GlxA family with amidase domain [Streptomyces coelicolor]TYP56505.1 transcriptional regulator GlxA family with amidase domain [Streptomyces coelicolor]